MEPVDHRLVVRERDDARQRLEHLVEAVVDGRSLYRAAVEQMYRRRAGLCAVGDGRYRGVCDFFELRREGNVNGGDRVAGDRDEDREVVRTGSVRG